MRWLFWRKPAKTAEPTVIKEPFSCPICNARIVLVGNAYHCVGLRNREEIVKYLGRFFEHLPDELADLPACGWRGLAKDFGTKWE